MAKLRTASAGAAVAAFALLLAVQAAGPAAAATFGDTGTGGTGAGGASSADNAARSTVLTTTDTTGVKAEPRGVLRALDVVTVSPALTRPGGSVDVRTFADCGGTTTGTVTSTAFAGPVKLGLAADGGLFAEAEVAKDAKPGPHPVTEQCSGTSVAVGTVTVVRIGALDTGGGWGATRGLAGSDALGTATGRGALAVTGAAALGALELLRRRALAARRGAGSRG
ncbi:MULTISPECIES: hypothetical protein [Streptacidiphilus]|uniref:Sortase n=1 Tax=Streptacidiphilus cavernicola TaxID=3342716 RepID=A0ABV6UE85_9ACTN|nr:hypothetical protein [Streptacidiphilus jeojiense]